MKKAIALIGESAPLEAIRKLKEDFKVYVLPKDPLISPQVCTHPDMILTIFDGKLFCHDSYLDRNFPLLNEIAQYANLELVPCKCTRDKEYPYDIAFNVLCINERLMGKAEFIAPNLRNYNIINTKQGYADCTSLFAGGCIVSADPSILKSAAFAGIPFHKIRGNGIKLAGYDTGFIGGCCGVFEDKIYICGDPATADAGRDLAEFCQKSAIELIPICNSNITDIGGIKFVPFSVANQLSSW